MRRFAAALLMTGLVGTAHAANDNAVAYRLYSEGKYAEAAEIFTDPSWKGAAFYKSDQFWRAAEAFVRADDPRSTYNLGNCYAQLGYYELALAAYLNALSREPGFADAAANADLMRKFLAEKDDSGQQGLQPQGRAIDEVEAQDRKDAQGGQQGDERGEAQEQRANADRDKSRASSDTKAETKTSDGRSGEGAERNEEEGAAGDNDIAGTQGEQSENRASGGSRSADEASDQQAAGARTRLETEQATQQWLNRIVDDPAKFLKARIALETRRRAAAGNAPAEGGDAW